LECRPRLPHTNSICSDALRYERDGSNILGAEMVWGRCGVAATRGWSLRPSVYRDFYSVIFLHRLSREACAIRAPVIRVALIAFSALVLCAPKARAAVRASIVVDADSGKVIEADNAGARTYPASLTKLMTLFLVFGEIRSGALTLGTPLKVSPHAAAQPATHLGLRAGESISVQQAILAIVTESANDAAVVLAEGVGGSEAGFATMMNRAALRLGMKDTTFCNASGLPNSHQLTTARDMATLALALIHNFPDDYHFFSVRRFVFHGRLIKGHDHLLGRYPGADGMKTGFTSASGFNLVSSARRHGCRLVGVVLGGASIRSRDRHMMRLLDVAFANTRHRAPRMHVAEANIDGASSAASAAAATTGRIVKASVSEYSDAEAPVVRWGVVVGGAFRRKSSARAAIRVASTSAPHELRRARSELARVVHHHRARYHARFVGLDKIEAARACRRLERKKFACHVVHWPTDFGVETASTS
jgi:D-alanyl-D-alanine carboxypeptidase